MPLSGRPLWTTGRNLVPLDVLGHELGARQVRPGLTAGRVPAMAEAAVGDEQRLTGLDLIGGIGDLRVAAPAPARPPAMTPAPRSRTAPRVIVEWTIGRELRMKRQLSYQLPAASFQLPAEARSWKPEAGSRKLTYQFTRIPKRSTRGATTALMLLAVAAFCCRCSAWTVLLFDRLNRSSDGTKCAGRSDRALDVESTFW